MMEEIEECDVNNSRDQDPKVHAKKKRHDPTVEVVDASSNVKRQKYRTPKAASGRTNRKPCKMLLKKEKPNDRNLIVYNEPDFEILGKSIEEKIEKWLKDCYLRGFHMFDQGLIYTVKKVVEKFSNEKRKRFPFEDNSPGKEWIFNFKKRHSKALENYKKSFKSKFRSAEENWNEWFMNTEAVLNRDDASDAVFDPARIYIMDELILKCDSENQLLFWDKRKARNEANSIEVSFMFAANAEGEIAPPLVVSEHVLSNRLSNNWQYESSDNGFIDCEIFFNYIANTFYPYVTPKCSFPIVIFLGCNFSYLSLPLCDFCKNKNISLICLPRNSNTIQSINTVFYRELNKKWEDLDLKSNNDQSVFERCILSLLQKSMNEGIIQPHIISRFQMNKIYPFNSQKSITKSIENISNVGNNRNSAIEYMESKIPRDIISQFKLCQHRNIPWNGSIFYAALYDMWLSIVDDFEVETDDSDDERFIEMDIDEKW